MKEMLENDWFWAGVEIGITIVIVWAILVKAGDMWRYKKLIKDYADEKDS